MEHKSELATSFVIRFTLVGHVSELTGCRTARHDRAGISVNWRYTGTVTGPEIYNEFSLDRGFFIVYLNAVKQMSKSYVLPSSLTEPRPD